MTTLRALAFIALTASPLVAQQIDITVSTPQVPGTPVQPQTCATLDSLLPGKRNLKAKLYRADIRPDTVLVTSEPLTSSNAERMTPPYLWVSAAIPANFSGSLPPQVQIALWAWGYPIFADKTPQGPHCLMALDKGASLDLGELKLDPMHRGVRFADPAKPPSGGQIVYTWTTGENLVQIARDRKAKAMLPGGWIGLSDEQRGGMAQVLMATLCGLKFSGG
jgi:hypothetical protein